MCVADGKLLLEKFERVSTVTVRLYCLCPEHPTAPNDACDQEKKKTARRFAPLIAKGFQPISAAIVPIGPDTPMPSVREPEHQ